MLRSGAIIRRMARTGQSKTVKMANGNRVTVTTGYSGGGYYRKVTVRRPDGTAESRTDRKNTGLFNTGLLDISGPYGDGVPRWAGGTQDDWGWGSMIVFALVVVAVFLFFGWPWLLHESKPTRVVIACVWYGLLLGTAFLVVSRKRRSRPPMTAAVPTHVSAVPKEAAVTPASSIPRPPSSVRPQVLGTESIWPQRFTDKWFRETGPFLSAAHALALGRELRMRGWSDEQIVARAAPHVPFRVI